MKLLHRSTPIGIVTDKQPDGMGYCADIQLLPAAEQCKPMFDFLIDEERNHEEPPFSEEWLHGWEMEDNEGKKQDIFTPCIDNNYTTVEWRW